MAFKMKGMAFKNTNDEKGAQYTSYDEMIASPNYQKALKDKNKQTHTFWTTTQDEPGGPTRKVIDSITTGEV